MRTFDVDVGAARRCLAKLYWGHCVNRLVGRAWLRTICFLAASAVAFGQSTIADVSPKIDGSAAHPAQQQTEGTDGPAGDLPDTPNPNDTQNKVVTLPQAIFHDQIGMWTSPSKVRYSDATWLVPLGGLTAAFFVTDSDFSRHLSADPNTQTIYRHISDYGAYSMVGGAAGTYFLGLVTHNEHQRESGFLSGEAAIDSLIAVEALKLVTGRQRPYQDNGDGQFWKGGASFPSEHAAAVWSIAGIMAHEYPSPFMKFLAYGMASTVSLARIGAKQHFPSDVLVGAAIGYLTSEYVYRKHHKPELPGAAWSFPAVQQGLHSNWPAKFMGSPYVPLDSWIYPAISRLTALGYINSAISDMRPWTRMECARQLSEAADRISGDFAEESEVGRLYRDLAQEFSREIVLLGGGDNAEIRLESAYTRSTAIVGEPLTDSYHFAQTVWNDVGRPAGQGFNNVSGGRDGGRPVHLWSMRTENSNILLQRPLCPLPLDRRSPLQISVAAPFRNPGLSSLIRRHRQSTVPTFLTRMSR